MTYKEHVLSIAIAAALITCAAVGIVVPSVAHAQFDFETGGVTGPASPSAKFVPLSNISSSAKIGNLFDSADLPQFLNRLFIGAIWLGAILAVLRLAYAGFVYMSSDLWGSKERAKEIIQDTLLGLFLLLAIWIILGQINPDIRKLTVGFATVSPVPIAPSATAPSVPLPSLPGSIPGTGTVYGGIGEIPVGAWCHPLGRSWRCFSNEVGCRSNPTGAASGCYQKMPDGTMSSGT